MSGRQFLGIIFIVFGTKFNIYAIVTLSFL